MKTHFMRACWAQFFVGTAFRLSACLWGIFGQRKRCPYALSPTSGGLWRACLLCSIILAFSLTTAFAQELGKPQESPKWFENIVAEFHGYHWFTDGKFIRKNSLDPLFGFSKLTHTTDSNLYIIGGELGYRMDFPFLRRITLEAEQAQGSSDSQRGIFASPVFSDPGRTDFLVWRVLDKISGEDSSKYLKATFYLRPLEGKISRDVKGFFDLSGEWIRYKDRATLPERFDLLTNRPWATIPDREKIRYEGVGIGFRGGFSFFERVSLKGSFVYYPSMSVKETEIWPARQKNAFFGRNEEGLRARITLGFTPFKERKRLEFEVGYQYMQFEQSSGRGRSLDLPTGVVSPVHLDRAVSYRDGFFAGGTVRW